MSSNEINVKVDLSGIDFTEIKEAISENAVFVTNRIDLLRYDNGVMFSYLIFMISFLLGLLIFGFCMVIMIMQSKRR